MVMPHGVLERLMPYHLFVEPDTELSALLTIFECTGAETFLEIGTYRGFTSAAIAVTFPKARVVTLDLPDPMSARWNPLPKAQVGDAHRALGVAHRIEQRWIDSAQMWRFAGKGEVYDLIFIDGDHSPGAVFRDLILAADLLPKGNGVIVVHDFTDVGESLRPVWTIGVCEAVERFLAVRPFRKRRLPGLLLALERE